MTDMDNTATPEKMPITRPLIPWRRTNFQPDSVRPDGRVVIDHDGQRYLLRQTQAGKLLLTK
ncbi:hemin uptake protein HemP [Escherichia coli]|nr:hemin uptake protein HemP [Escherichia coli]